MKIFILIIALLLSTTMAFAHGDHVHKPKIEAAQATKKAKTHIPRLITEGKIDPTWKDAEFIKSEKKKMKSTWEWVNTFKNTKETDATKQTLYVFLALSGEFVAANFSGK